MRTRLRDGGFCVGMLPEEGLSMKRQTQRSLLMVFVVGALVFCGRAASAGTVTWTGAGANANWSNPTNWDSNPSLPATTDSVLIGANWTSGNVVVGGSAGSPVVVNSLALQNNSAADRTISGGYLQLTSGVVSRAVVSGSSRTIVFAPTTLYLPAGTNNSFIDTSTIYWSAAIQPIGGSGAMTIVKTGAGQLLFYNNTQVYPGNWDYTGDLFINAGNSLGQGTFTWRGGGTMTIQNGGYKSFTNNIVLTGGNCNFRPADTPQTNTFSGIFSGGPATLFFNAQPASGSMTVLSGSNSMASSGFVLVGETVRLDAPGFLTPCSSVAMGWGTASASLIWNIAETATNFFYNRITAGGYSQLAMNTNGTTTLTGQYSMNNSTTQGGDLRLSTVAGGTLALTGVITDQKNTSGTAVSTPTNSHALVKLGAGTVILSCTNDYRGGTVVSNGTLLVQNATGTVTGTNTVLVCSGATLGGTGRVAGAVSILPGGTLAPGGTNIVGTLTVSNSVTFAAGSTNIVDIQAGGSDKLSLTGALQLNGAALQVMLPVGFTVPPGTVYTIATGFTGLDTNCFSGLPDGAMVNAGGTALTIHYNTTASPKTITLKRNTGTLIRIN